MGREIDHDADLLAFARGVVEVGPTVREFADLSDFSSTSVASYHLRALYEAGLIARRDNWFGESRAWVLTPEGERRLAELGVQRRRQEA